MAQINHVSTAKQAAAKRKDQRDYVGQDSLYLALKNAPNPTARDAIIAAELRKPNGTKRVITLLTQMLFKVDA